MGDGDDAVVPLRRPIRWLTREQRQLVDASLGSIRRLVRRRARRWPWMSIDELDSEASLALCEMARSYLPGPVPFLAYAMKHVLGKVKARVHDEYVHRTQLGASALDDAFALAAREGVDVFTDTEEAARQHLVSEVSARAGAVAIAGVLAASHEESLVTGIALEQAVARLDAGGRRLYDLRIRQGLEQREVARELGRSVRTVRRDEALVFGQVIRALSEARRESSRSSSP